MALTGISVLDGVDPLVDEGVVLIALQAAVTHSEVEGIVQEGLVVRADIENDGQDGCRANSTSSDVLFRVTINRKEKCQPDCAN